MSQAAAPAAAPSGPFYGWTIAAVCVAIYFFTNGLSIFVPQNLFPRFIETFGVTEAEISRTIAITFAVSGVLAPFVGAAIDRLGVLRVIRTGLVILAVTFSLYPFAQSVGHLYLLHVAVGVGLIFAGLMPNVVLLSNWFAARRGAAVGLLVAGSSLAGAILPLAISPLVTDPGLGWRYGWASLAAAFWLLAVLPGFLLLRQSPADVGQYPDGAPAPSPGATAQPLAGVPFARAIRTRTLWCLAIGSASLWFSMQAITSQASLFFEQEAGYEPAAATQLYSLLMACSVAGKFAFGALSDRLAKRHVMLLTSVTMLIGCLLLFTVAPGGIELTRNHGQLMAFAVVFGLGFGGSFTLIQLTAVESFGQLALGRILGLVTFVDTIGGMLGALLGGQIRTATGDYFATFALVAAIGLIAVLNVLLIRPVPFARTPATAGSNQ